MDPRNDSWLLNGSSQQNVQCSAILWVSIKVWRQTPLQLRCNQYTTYATGNGVYLFIIYLSFINLYMVCVCLIPSRRVVQKPSTYTHLYKHTPDDVRLFLILYFPSIWEHSMASRFIITVSFGEDCKLWSSSLQAVILSIFLLLALS